VINSPTAVRAKSAARNCHSFNVHSLLADRPNGRAYATLLRPSVRPSVCRLSVTCVG